MSRQVVAQGLLLTPNAYLKSGWNRLDAFIVLVSLLVDLSHEAAAHLGSLLSAGLVRWSVRVNMSCDLL